MNKILEITEMKPQPATLPDGKYIGSWGGFLITVDYNSRTYTLKTERGVKGFGVKVLVTVLDGVATFEEFKNRS